MRARDTAAIPDPDTAADTAADTEADPDPDTLPMRLLVFSDLHRDTQTARQLVERASADDVDAVVCAGDLGTTRQGLGEIVATLRPIALPTILVAGNSESPDELREACRDWPAALPLHGTQTTVGETVFFGLGGAVPVTPFGSWSFDLTEDEAEALLADLPQDAILVTHSPPLGHVDIDSSGRHLGSRAVLAAIESRRPRWVICGHIHASWGCRSRIGVSTIINAGPAGTLIEL